ncbi:unnamed protein product, partial [Mesorhabditis spiculigera]
MSVIYDQPRHPHVTFHPHYDSSDMGAATYANIFSETADVAMQEPEQPSTIDRAQLTLDFQAPERSTFGAPTVYEQTPLTGNFMWDSPIIEHDIDGITLPDWSQLLMKRRFDETSDADAHSESTDSRPILTAKRSRKRDVAMDGSENMESELESSKP